MSSTVKPIPDGYHSITPYLIVNGAAQAIEYYQTVFGATESVRMPLPDGKVAHAEIKIGDSVIMLADECAERGVRSPAAIGGSPVLILVYLENVDAVVAKAVAAGGQLLKPVADQFYGDRSGAVVDPFGHHWTIATHVEDVSPEEMGRRMAAFMGQNASACQSQPA